MYERILKPWTFVNLIPFELCVFRNFVKVDYIVFGNVSFIFNHNIHVPSHEFLRRGLEVRCKRGRTISNFASIDKDAFHFMKKLARGARDC